MYADEFPLDPSIVHLNHAAVAPWPLRTQRAVTAFAEENQRLGSRQYARWLQTEDDLREQLRQLINAASTDEIALLKSTSEALSVVAHGLDWQDGDEVVISDQEFPSNRIVWESLSRYGVRVREARLQDAETPEQAVYAAVTDNTRLISLSSVQYASGLRLDLAPIGAFCRQRELLFCVDAIQSLGAEPFDVQAVQAHFVMADGHKWMLGPEGLALFYCHRDWLERLRLHQYGWHMVANAGDFDRKDWVPAPTAKRFECGSPNMLGVHALHASLSLLLEVGLDEVANLIRKNTDFLLDFLELHAQEYQVISDFDPQRRAGILNFTPLRQPADQLYTALQEAGVLCALRGGGIRFSPHFYTPQSSMERALERL